MANALDVISLQQAKEFLVVDYDGIDDEIQQCIETAVNYVETYTNVMLYQRPRTYTLIRECTEIYDYPLDLPLGLNMTSNVLSVTVRGKIGQVINAQVGYVGNTDTPAALLMACKKLIMYFFENKDIYNADIPWDVQMLLNSLRRSATI